MKYLPGISYLVKFFKRKSIKDQLPISHSADSQLDTPSDTLLDAPAEQNLSKTFQLLAEKEGQQRNPQTNVWQKILKITKDNNLLKEHQPKSVKVPTENKCITPPLHATATATANNVSVKFMKGLTFKRRNSFPQQFQMYQLNYRLDHENDNRYINREDMYQKLDVAIPHVDYQAITIGSSITSDPSLGEETNTTESSNEERFYSDNGLASSTLSEPKKEKSKGHGLYPSNIWTPKNIEPEESWRIAFGSPQKQQDQRKQQILGQTHKQEKQQMRLQEQSKEQLKKHFQQKQKQLPEQSQQQEKRLLEKSQRQHKLLQEQFQQEQKQLREQSQQHKLLQEKFQQEQKQLREQSQQHKLLQEKFQQEQKQLREQSQQHKLLQEKLEQQQKQLQEQLEQQQRVPVIDFNGKLYYDHQQTTMPTNGGYSAQFSAPLYPNQQPTQIQMDYQQQFPLQPPRMTYINQARPQNQLFQPVQHPHMYQPIQQPNTYQHVQQPNMYQHVQQPNMYQHVQQPNMFQHVQQPNMFQHVQQNFVEQPVHYQTFTPVQQYGFLPDHAPPPLIPQHGLLSAEHFFAAPSVQPQPIRPPAPQPDSRLTQETAEADVFSENLRIVLDTASPKGLKEEESRFRLSPSARIIRPIAKRPERPNHDMPIPVDQLSRDDDESLIEDTYQQQASLMMLLKRRRTPFKVQLEYFPSIDIDSSVVLKRGNNGLKTPVNVFRDEQRRFIEDIRRFGHPVFKNSPWDEGFYTSLDVLGRGLSGDVYSVMKSNQKIGPTYAIKTLKLFQISEQGREVFFEDKYVMQEVYIMTRLRHKNLMKLNEVFVDKNSVYMVMPLMECSLLNVVFNRPEGYLEEHYAVYAFYEVAKGLKFLHSKGLYHCDIKCENIFVDTEGGVKLGDFGLVHSINEPNYTVCGTMNYMSPETANQDRSSNEKSDLWSMGIILIEMLDGNPPKLLGDTDEQKLCHIAALKTGPWWSRCASPPLRFLIDQLLLNVRPKSRLTAYQLENNLYQLIHRRLISCAPKKHFSKMMRQDKAAKVNSLKQGYE